MRCVLKYKAVHRQAKKFRCALIAQLDRVFGYEPKGRGFESLSAHHKRRIYPYKVGYMRFYFSQNRMLKYPWPCRNRQKHAGQMESRPQERAACPVFCKPPAARRGMRGAMGLYAPGCGSLRGGVGRQGEARRVTSARGRQRPAGRGRF